MPGYGIDGSRSGVEVGIRQLGNDVDADFETVITLAK